MSEAKDFVGRLRAEAESAKKRAFGGGTVRLTPDEAQAIADILESSAEENDGMSCYEAPWSCISDDSGWKEVGGCPACRVRLALAKVGIETAAPHYRPGPWDGIERLVPGGNEE